MLPLVWLLPAPGAIPGTLLLFTSAPPPPPPPPEKWAAASFPAFPTLQWHSLPLGNLRAECVCPFLL